MNLLPLRFTPSASHARAREAITRFMLSRNMAAGEKLPPQAELVKVLNCSETTIQKAMKELVDEGIVRREVGRGTYLLRLPEAVELEALAPAALTVNGRVAICALDDRDTRPAYSPGLEILHATEQRLLTHNGVIETRLAVCSSLKMLTDLLQEIQPDGLVLDWRFNPLDAGAWRIQQHCLSLEYPVVHCFHVYHPDVSAAYQICIDNQSIAFAAMKHLTALGHEHILVAASGNAHDFQNLRLAAIEHFCQVSGTRYQVSLAPSGARDREWLEAGHAAFARWITIPRKERPSAVFALNDQIGLAFVKEARKAGLKVPAEVSVVGVDNDLHHRLEFGIDLTTLDPCRAEIGNRAAEQVLSAMQTRTPHEHHVIKIQPKLVNRGTTTQLAC
ncbi:MAG: substrate-binding domain-containing protein [Planctomycetes bacterium]|nr:substrate-binding domain-containing protein [Planctomycetota bacterium]